MPTTPASNHLTVAGLPRSVVRTSGRWVLVGWIPTCPYHHPYTPHCLPAALPSPTPFLPRHMQLPSSSWDETVYFLLGPQIPSRPSNGWLPVPTCRPYAQALCSRLDWLARRAVTRAAHARNQAPPLHTPNTQRPPDAHAERLPPTHHTYRCVTRVRALPLRTTRCAYARRPFCVAG